MNEFTIFANSLGFSIDPRFQRFGKLSGNNLKNDSRSFLDYAVLQVGYGETIIPASQENLGSREVKFPCVKIGKSRKGG
jgi:hypothetical protein